MKDHKDCSRQYIVSSRAWYKDYACLRDQKFIINFGMYHLDGSTSGEMHIAWYELCGELCGKLECFEDSFNALSLFKDLIEKLGEVDSENIQPDDFIKILNECSFVDRTQYERPEN